MAFRFRRSVRLAPGLRLNIGKRGVSLSSGVRGASVTLGRRGLYGNVGAPGTGMSYRQKLSGSSNPSRAYSQSNSSSNSPGNIQIQFILEDDGSVRIADEGGNALPSKYQKIAREQKGDIIQEWLNEQCENWNKGIDHILNLHLETPPPDLQIDFEPIPFEISLPRRPQPRTAGFWGLFSKKHKEAVEAENASALRNYEISIFEWEAQKAEHEKHEDHRRWLIKEGRFHSKEAMEEFLEAILADIDWPRETTASFEVSEDGSTVLLDVDLPEVEDMPTESASVAGRGLKINIKKRTDTQIRKEYMAHIHAIAFRLIGEVFAALPRATQVVCSGFSQRPDPKTGHIQDDYLYSVRVSRDEWTKLNFDDLSLIDHVEYFENFEIQRNVTKTGVFKPIEPISIAFDTGARQ